LIQVKAACATDAEDPAMTLPLPKPHDWPFDAELLRRYDGPGPRYTSYPTAPHFSADFSAQDFVRAAVNSNVGAFSRLLSLYLHVPFCRSPCFYCGCNRSITRDQAQGDEYVALLKREIALVAPLFDGSREVIQLHLGGGTPNFLRPAQLADLVAELGRLFAFSDDPGRDFSIELDPRFVDANDIAVLASAGFNRASLGVQDFDPQVQLAVNRIQSLEQTREIVDACRDQKMRSVNIDLIYGLPLQTQRGFARTLEQVIALRPDRLGGLRAGDPPPPVPAEMAMMSYMPWVITAIAAFLAWYAWTMSKKGVLS